MDRVLVPGHCPVEQANVVDLAFNQAVSVNAQLAPIDAPDLFAARPLVLSTQMLRAKLPLLLTRKAQSAVLATPNMSPIP
jgi:hypothetical protein